VTTLRIAWELFRYRPGRWTLAFIAWTVIHASPVILGLLVGMVFERLSGGAAAAESAWTPVLVFTAIALSRNGVLAVGDLLWIEYWLEQVTQLRRNMLRWVLEAPGSRHLPVGPGEAVSTFRDDVDDLVEYVENFVDLGGLLAFAAGAVYVMFRIDPGVAAIVLAPLVLTTAVTQALSPQIRARRRAMRTATEAVTGFVGETMGSVQAVKLARAEDRVLDEFRRRNLVRRRAALRDTFLTEVLRSVNANMATVAIAVVLIVSAGDVRSGAFDVGELAVFLTYLPRLTGYMAFAGDIIAQHRRTGVAYERIKALLVDADDSVVLDRTRVPLRDVPEGAPPVELPEVDELRRLEVRGLGYTYPDGEAGIEDVSFVVERGSFVVVTGKIGAGKTTLLRALLGLVPAEGEILWNGEPVDDPAAFLIPPRSAYTPQVPRLFSDTLADNIALGAHVTRERLREAVSLAVLDPDLERLEDGLDTLVGARGVKLSGGQVQRSAAARMFAARAELLVFDDLSAALDLHTEQELWDRLFDTRTATCLVVSHRHRALERADRIVLLDGGRVADVGRLGELLERSPLMRELWEDPDG
jgi:ATP-binding cassette subfamily B protein